jgi:hypothetical protein
LPESSGGLYRSFLQPAKVLLNPKVSFRLPKQSYFDVPTNVGGSFLMERVNRYTLCLKNRFEVLSLDTGVEAKLPDVTDR